MALTRSAGVLMHPTSLPGPDGIGTVGAPARRFVDRLADAHQSWWQILPLNTPGHGGSPYSAMSAFAGNDLLVDLDQCVARGWLKDAEVADFRRQIARRNPARRDPARLDYPLVGPPKSRLLDLAFDRWRQDPDDRQAFDAFRRHHRHWLADYTLFTRLKSEFDGRAWLSWPDPYVRREPDALAQFRHDHARDLDKLAWRQWRFFEQWQQLREYAGARGVQFIGDLPIFVAMDSADVWANRQRFQIDRRGRVDEVSGVPPDYFSETGQKWGNPLYDWPTIAADGFAWWRRRIQTVMETVDLIRIDHFRGFEAYWAVPADADTAIDGRWRDGPRDALFDAIDDELGGVPFIAEDLGMITDAVIELRDRHGLPGMKVMQFADFDDPDHIFLPKNYAQNFVAYTGTHDNNTTRGWYEQLDDASRHAVRRYLSCGDDDVVWSMIEAVVGSAAALAVVPVQDIFGLDSTARMNRPGGNGRNWTWRAPQAILTRETPWEKLGKLTDQSERQ